jgi:hypothetical protein
VSGSVAGWLGGGSSVTAQKLRQWRGVKPVAGPCGVAISTRLPTTPEDDRVFDLVDKHMGRLRTADLATVTRPEPLDPAMDEAAKRQARRERLNNRKSALTAESSARWANAIIAGNDARYRLARDAQHRHIIGLRAAIEKHLANAKHGRYVLSGRAVFAYRADDGGRGSPAENRCPTPSAVSPAGRAATSPRPGHARHRLPTISARRDRLTMCGRAGRLWGWISTTDTSRCGTWMRTATRSADPSASTSTCRGRQSVGMPRSGMRLPGSSTTPPATASTPSRWKTLTSPTPAPTAAKRWAEERAANASAEPSPGSRPRCSAVACAGRPTATVSDCSRSMPPTRVRGVINIGVHRMRT